MAITPAELDRVRLELETKITSVTVDHVSMAQAIGSYGERFTGIEARFNGVEARFSGVEARIDAVDLRLDALTADISRLEGRIDRMDSKLDARFNAQTVLMTVLGVLVLFGDPIRSALGL